MDLLEKLRALRSTVAAISAPHLSAPEESGLTGNLTSADYADGVAALLHAASDADLLGAFQRTTAEPGDPEAEALLAAVQRRGLTDRPV